MKKKVIPVIIFLGLILFYGQFDAAGASSNLEVHVEKNKTVTINIWMKTGEAVMYFSGNHMFKMSAKYLPIAGAARDNLIELKGDGFRKIHLNKSRKILFFREGTEKMKGLFANVTIEKQGDKLVVKFDKNQGIDININMSRKTAVLYLKGNHMFEMSAKYLAIAGAASDNLIELKGNGLRKIHLNKSRKILYFREGTKGEFARVTIN